MPTNTNYTIIRYEDGTITLAMNPEIPLGGDTIKFSLMKRFGGDTLIERWISSGMNGQSGISMVNSGQGILNIQIRSEDSSGRDYGNYAFTIERMDSGYRTCYAQGYEMLNP